MDKYDEFIEQIAPAAVEVCNRYGLYPSVCIAQTCIESSWGEDAIGVYNLWGRKAADGDEFITFNCETAWSPPTGFCKLLSEKYYVNVRCEYEEPGCHFAGHYEIDTDGNEDEETLDYLEGIHKNDEEHFDHEIRSRIEDSIECEETFEEFIEPYNFEFLGENWKEELKEMWDEVLTEKEV